MKATEFRIGNYIYWNGLLQEVDLSILFLLQNIDKLNELKVSISPIPLTEQWLKDLKLEEEDKRFRVQECGTIFYIEVSKGITLYVDLEEKEMWIEGYEGELIEVFYQLPFKGEAHSFQNLYFALTGKELEKH